MMNTVALYHSTDHSLCRNITYHRISNYGEPTIIKMEFDGDNLDFSGKEIWDACVSARLHFEQAGYLIGWNICGLNAVQSPLQYKTGMSVYLVELGKSVDNNESLADSFKLNSDIVLATVAEQAAFKVKWHESIGLE